MQDSTSLPDAGVVSTQSTAKHDSDAAPPRKFTWAFPGSPISIQVPFRLIANLQVDLDLNEHLAQGSAIEVGGILFGEQKSRSLIEITGYTWIPTVPQLTRRYQLDLSELQRVRGSNNKVIGHFRTASDGTLGLRDEELSFVAEEFRDKTNVVLLIDASTLPYNAGFFFWMSTGAFAPISFMDFPMNAEILRSQIGSTSDLYRDSRVSTKRSALAAARQDRASDSDLEARLGPASSTFQLGPDLAPPVSDMGQTEQTRKPNEIAAISLRKMTDTLRPVPVIIGLLLLSVVFTGTLLFLGRHPRTATIQNVGLVGPAFPLGLEVEARNRGLDIHWNPQSPVVRQASEGRLLITENGAQARIISLTLQELTSGHAYYLSSGRPNRTQFQLEIVDGAGKVSKESVLAFSYLRNTLTKPQNQAAGSSADK